MRVRYTIRARNDLRDIGAYLRRRSPAAARAVVGLIERRISALADFPLAAPETDEAGIYELLLMRYPYKIYYEIEGDEVWVLHIRDARREPWIERS